MVKKPRRHTPVIAESESAAVAPPVPLVSKLSAQKQATDKAVPDLGKTSSIFATHIYTYTYVYIFFYFLFSHAANLFNL